MSAVPTPVLRRLAVPGTEDDRRRARLVSFSVAGAGAFLLAAVALLSIPGPRLVEIAGDGTGRYQRDPAILTLAPFLSQQGLSRSGERATAVGAFLLVIAFVLLGVQALRTGTAARERRLAALSLAGATGPQLRRLAFLEGGRAAAIGGLLAGPGYLLLWFGLGHLLPSGSRLLPAPGLAVALAWPLLVIELAAAGGLAAALAARPAVVSPLGLTRRGARPLTRVDVVPPVGFLVALGIGLALAWRGDGGAVFVLLPATVGLSITGGRWLVLLIARLAVRGDGLVSSLAGYRLLADVRSPGRVAAVLFTVGVALAITTRIGAEELNSAVSGDTGTVGSTLGTIAAALLTALIAATVASVTLAVGATEQVLDGRRGTAVLVALAASPQFVHRVVRRQLMLAAVPAAVLGALIGRLAISDVTSGQLPNVQSLLSLPIAVLIAALAAVLGALVAARVVAPAIRAAATPDNLRAP